MSVIRYHEQAVIRQAFHVFVMVILQHILPLIIRNNFTLHPSHLASSSLYSKRTNLSNFLCRSASNHRKNIENITKKP